MGRGDASAEIRVGIRHQAAGGFGIVGMVSRSEIRPSRAEVIPTSQRNLADIPCGQEADPESSGHRREPQRPAR